MLLNTHVTALYFTFSKYSREVISAETVYGEQPKKKLLMLYHIFIPFFDTLSETFGESFASIFKFSASEGSGDRIKFHRLFILFIFVRRDCAQHH